MDGRERDEAFCVMGSALMRKMPPKTKSQQASKIEKKQQVALQLAHGLACARGSSSDLSRVAGRGGKRSAVKQEAVRSLLPAKVNPVEIGEAVYYIGLNHGDLIYSLCASQCRPRRKIT